MCPGFWYRRILLIDFHLPRAWMSVAEWLRFKKSTDGPESRVSDSMWCQCKFRPRSARAFLNWFSCVARSRSGKSWSEGRAFLATSHFSSWGAEFLSRIILSSRFWKRSSFGISKNYALVYAVFSGRFEDVLPSQRQHLRRPGICVQLQQQSAGRQRRPFHHSFSHCIPNQWVCTWSR